MEQSRIVARKDNKEGNFHTFYYLLRGLENENRLQDYYLTSRHYKYLEANRNNISAKSNHLDKWMELKKSFKIVGFHSDQIDSIYRILAAILNLGEIDFVEEVSNDTDNKASILDMMPAHKVASLLGVDKDDLLEALTSNSVVTRGEIIVKNNTVDEAIATRDSMAKVLYGRLFDWIVNHINTILCTPSSSTQQLSIGLLDLFGFENFERNSFEQLMINIANEQIQYYFNQKIFSWEQQEYQSEGISIDLVEFADNRPVLDLLLSRPIGLLALLDEECRFLKSSDSSLIEKFHGNIKSKFYQRPKSNALCFGIHHYAGRVIYNADGFLEKNKNFLPQEIIQLIRGSQYDVIRFLFQCPITKTGNLYSPHLDDGTQASESILMKINTRERVSSSGKGLASQSRAQQTAATYFRFSLMDLLQKMVAGTPQFVRCIKPNEQQMPQLFEDDKVIKQLNHAGVLETIRIRQRGFSHRFLFADFLKKYSFLGFSYNERIVASRDTAKQLLTRLRIDNGYMLGKSKVFLKYYHIEYLSELYKDKLRKIILIQSLIRRWIAKKFVEKLRYEKFMSAVTLQKHARGWLTRKKMKLLQELPKSEKKIEVADKKKNWKYLVEKQNNENVHEKIDRNNLEGMKSYK